MRKLITAKECEQAGLASQLSTRNTLLDALVAELQTLRQEVRVLIVGVEGGVGDRFVFAEMWCVLH